MVATSADPRQDLDRTSGLVVLDERGVVFTRIRTLDLDVAIWRTRQMPDASESPEPGTLLVLAAYEPPDWARIHGLARRFSTVVAMHPVGHEDAVAALEAGAVGLLDSEMPTEAMRRALRGALRGEPVFSREVLGTWLRGSRGRLRSTVASVDGLTRPAAGDRRLDRAWRNGQGDRSGARHPYGHRSEACRERAAATRGTEPRRGSRAVDEKEDPGARLIAPYRFLPRVP